MSTKNFRVCLVEDNEMVRNSYRNLLSMHNLEPTCFESAESMLDTVHDIDFDCVVVDLRLPGMNGYQLIQKLRAQGYLDKIVLISGNIDLQMKDRVDELENVHLLNKPCLPTEFIDVVVNCAMEKSAS